MIVLIGREINRARTLWMLTLLALLLVAVLSAILLYLNDTAEKTPQKGVFVYNESFIQPEGGNS